MDWEYNRAFDNVGKIAAFRKSLVCSKLDNNGQCMIKKEINKTGFKTTENDFQKGVHSCSFD